MKNGNLLKLRASEICVMQGVGVQGYLKERVLLLFLPKSLQLRQRSRIDEEDEANVKKQKTQCCEFFSVKTRKEGAKVIYPKFYKL